MMRIFAWLGLSFLALLVLETTFPAFAKADTFSYRPDQDALSQMLDIYSFEGAVSAPVMVYVHGGGWVIGSKNRVQDKPEYFNEMGFVLVSVEYGMVPDNTVEGQLTDIDDALFWVSQNIGRFGGDAGNIHLLGHSAGAHLVAMTGVAPRQHAAQMIANGEIRTVIANDTRAYDLPRIAQITPGDGLTRVYARPFGQDPARWRALSPLYQTDSSRNIPDFLIMYSGQGADSVRRSFAEEFAAKLQQAGASATLFDGSRYSHGEINKGIGRTREISAAITAFLARRH